MSNYTEKNNGPLIQCGRTCYKSACVTTDRIPYALNNRALHALFTPHLMYLFSAYVIVALNGNPQFVCFSALNAFSAYAFPHLTHSVRNFSRAYMLSALCCPHSSLEARSKMKQSRCRVPQEIGTGANLDQTTKTHTRR